MTPEQRDKAMDEWEACKRALRDLHEELSAAECDRDHEEAAFIRHAIRRTRDELEQIEGRFPECSTVREWQQADAKEKP